MARVILLAAKNPQLRVECEFPHKLSAKNCFSNFQFTANEALKLVGEDFCCWRALFSSIILVKQKK